MHIKFAFSDKIIEKAKNYAIQIHANDRTPLDQEPYLNYLGDVVKNAALCLPSYHPSFREIIITAWLHGSLSYNATTPEEIHQLFGKRVLAYVLALTPTKLNAELAFHDACRRMETAPFAVRFVYLCSCFSRLSEYITGVADDSELFAKIRELWLTADAAFNADNTDLSSDEVVSLELIYLNLRQFLAGLDPEFVK